LIKLSAVSFFLLLLICSGNGVAASSNPVIYNDANVYKHKVSRSVLITRESSFINKQLWNFNEAKNPPYSMSKAIIRALNWAKNTHKVYTWELVSVELRFYNEIEGSCVYIIRFRSKNTKPPKTSYLSIGVDMSGGLIKPIIMPKEQFNKLSRIK